jgi:DNA-binding MarR family transcriptional regulator
MSPRTENPDALRALSHRLFGGARYRIEVGAAIADRKLIANITEIANELGIERQTVAQELRRLEHAGLLRRADQQERKVYLIGAKSLYWELCRELRAEAEALLSNVKPY